MSAESKKITMENLALMIKESEKRIIEAVDTKIDELAVITKHGFDGIGEQFKKVDEQFDEVNEKLDDLNKSNSQAHENTSLRLSEVAYSFELTALKKRVEVLEHKAEIHA